MPIKQPRTKICMPKKPFFELWTVRLNPLNSSPIFAFPDVLGYLDLLWPTYHTEFGVSSESLIPFFFVLSIVSLCKIGLRM